MFLNKTVEQTLGKIFNILCREKYKSFFISILRNENC